MPAVLAHFTVAELPGTAAILLTGLTIGLVARTRLDLFRGLALAVLAGFGFIAATADHAAWASNVAETVPGNGWDWLWLTAAVVAASAAAKPLLR